METIGTTSLLHKILSGNIRVKSSFGTIIIRQPCADLRYAADFFAEDVYDDAFASGILTEEESEDILIINKWWTDEQNNELEQIPKDLEQMKVDYFNSFHSPKTKELVKRAIKLKEDRYLDLQHEKLSFAHYTCENLRSEAYLHYIIAHSSFYENGEAVDYSKVNISTIINRYQNELISDDKIREISKSYKWRSLWTSGKNIFNNNLDLTDMQISLIGWSRTYDSIYESPDCPIDEIINDDYAIDGWFAVQRRKRKDENIEKQQDNYKGQEVFIIAKGKEDAINVNKINTQQGKNIIQSRFNDLKNRGSLDEGQFSHVKNDLQMQANKAGFKRK